MKQQSKLPTIEVEKIRDYYFRGYVNASELDAAVQALFPDQAVIEIEGEYQVSFDDGAPTVLVCEILLFKGQKQHILSDEDFDSSALEEYIEHNGPSNVWYADKDEAAINYFLEEGQY